MEPIAARQPFGVIVVIKRDGTDGGRFELVTQNCLFGREEGCDVRIQLPSVRPQHCRIEVDLADERLYIIHLAGGEFPTRLNGSIIQTKTGLSHKDIFTIGDRSFRCEIPDYYSSSLQVSASATSLEYTVRAPADSSSSERLAPKSPARAERPRLISFGQSPSRVAAVGVEVPKSPSRSVHTPLLPQRPVPRSPARAEHSRLMSAGHSPSRVAVEVPKSSSRIVNTVQHGTSNFTSDEVLTRSPIRTVSPARSLARIDAKTSGSSNISGMMSSGISPSTFFARKPTAQGIADKSSSRVATASAPDQKSPARGNSPAKMSVARSVDRNRAVNSIKKTMPSNSGSKLPSSTHSPARNEARTPPRLNTRTDLSASASRIQNIKMSTVTPIRSASASAKSTERTKTKVSQSAKKAVESVKKVAQASLTDGRRKSRKSLGRSVDNEAMEGEEMVSARSSKAQSASPDITTRVSLSPKKNKQQSVATPVALSTSVIKANKSKLLSPSPKKSRSSSVSKTSEVLSLNVQEVTPKTISMKSVTPVRNKALSSNSTTKKVGSLRKEKGGGDSASSKVGKKKSEGTGRRTRTLSPRQSPRPVVVSDGQSGSPTASLSIISPSQILKGVGIGSKLRSPPKEVSDEGTDSKLRSPRMKAFEKKSPAPKKVKGQNVSGVSNNDSRNGEPSEPRRSKSLTASGAITPALSSPNQILLNESHSSKGRSKSQTRQLKSSTKAVRRTSGSLEFAQEEGAVNSSTPEETWNAIASTLDIKLTPAQKAYSSHKSTRDSRSSTKRHEPSQKIRFDSSGSTTSRGKRQSKSGESPSTVDESPGLFNPIIEKNTSKQRRSSIMTAYLPRIDLSLMDVTESPLLASPTKSGSPMRSESLVKSRGRSRSSSTAKELKPRTPQSSNKQLLENVDTSPKVTELSSPLSSGSKRGNRQSTSSDAAGINDASIFTPKMTSVNTETKNSQAKKVSSSGGAFSVRQKSLSSTASPLFVQSMNDSGDDPQTTSVLHNRSASLGRSSGPKVASNKHSDLPHQVSSITSSSSRSISHETKELIKAGRSFMASTPQVTGRSQLVDFKSEGRTRSAEKEQQPIPYQEQLTRPPIRGSGGSTDFMPVDKRAGFSTLKCLELDNSRGSANTPSSSDSSSTFKSAKKKKVPTATLR